MDAPQDEPRLAAFAEEEKRKTLGDPRAKNRLLNARESSRDCEDAATAPGAAGRRRGPHDFRAPDGALIAARE